VEEESETVIVQRRSLHANRDIKKGEVIGLEDIIELRPAVGILPKYKKSIIGKKAKIDILKHEAIKQENID
jgi:sialic acid synthase SpsE